MFSNYLRRLKIAGDKVMASMIDVRDLPEKDVRLIERLVKRLRTRAKREKTRQEEKDDISFATWPLGVKGNLPREEIYDYL
jgi:hypothetical protein